MITYGSVCSGIEAASVAWEPLGFRPSWFSQFDPEHNYKRGPDFPSAVLAHHWPHVANLGDMTLIADAVSAGFIEAPDVLVGGTPCQAFSVAGLRGGLSDGRGFLTLKFVELADAIDKQRPGNQSIIVWENVPGVLSSKDNAFGCFLAGLAGESEPLVAPGGKWSNAGCVSGPSRTIAWRVLDAQYFGVAQRRRRVFVVASAREGFDPTAVLFEFDGVRRNIAPSREAGKAVAGATGAGADQRGKWPAEIACTLTAHAGETGKGDAAPCVATAHVEVMPTMVSGGSEDGTGRGQPIVTAFSAKDYGADATNNMSPTLRAGNQNSGNWMAVAIHENTRAELRESDVSPTLSAGGGKPGQGYSAIRRLTPVECERLQGFPDDHTLLPGRSADGPRYKALGNSMAVPVMRWIGNRILLHILGAL